MKSRTFPLLLVATLAVTLAHGAIVKEGPFVGFDLSKVSSDEARAILEANEDFSRIVSGLPPQHAKVVPFPSGQNEDRADQYLSFKGIHYSITVYKLPIQIGREVGVIFGPQLQFHQDFSEGFIPIVSQQRFFTRDELAFLLRGDATWTKIPSEVWRGPKTKKK
jgi:hypothetical protein